MPGFEFRQSPTDVQFGPVLNYGPRPLKPAATGRHRADAEPEKTIGQTKTL